MRTLAFIVCFLLAASFARAQPAPTPITGPEPLGVSANFASREAQNQLRVVRPSEYGAVGNTQTAPAPTYTTSGGATLEIPANRYYSNVTANCNGTTTVTVTLPAGATMPLFEHNIGSRAVGIYLSACGSSYVYTQLQSISGSGQSYTLTLLASTTSTGTSTGASMLTFDWYFGSNYTGSGPGTSSSLSRMFYTSGCSLGAGSNQLACPSGTFNSGADVSETGSNAQMNMQILVRDPTGTCADQIFTILSSTTTTATLGSPPGGAMGGTPPGSPATASCPISSSNYVQLFWGPTVFASYMTGETVDVPNAGPTVSGAATDWVSTISSITDPFYVTLASNASQTLIGTSELNQISVGTDDTAAINAMLADLPNKGTRIAYWPNGFNTFYGTPNMANFANAVLCNDGLAGGRIVYRQDVPFPKQAGQCFPARPYPTLRGDLTLGDNFRQLSTCTNCTVVVVGDSGCVPSSNGLGEQDLSYVFTKFFLDVFPSKTFTVLNRCIGSTGYATFDVSNPGSSGIPTSAEISSASGWYTNSGSTWNSYVAALCPDAVVFHFTNDEQSLNIPDFNNAITQSQAYASTCGKAPDVFMTSGYLISDAAMSTNPSQYEGQLYVSQFLRSAVRAGYYPALTNGGRVGLLDVESRAETYAYGRDPVRAPLRRSQANVQLGPTNNLSATFAFPYTWRTNILSYGANIAWQMNSNASVSTFFSSSGYLALAIPMGAGSIGTPGNGNGNTGAFTTGYPGNEMLVTRDTSGNYAVEELVYNYSTTATVTTNTGAKTIVCTAACENWGHVGASISMVGPGSSACPWFVSSASTCYNDTITNVSTDGKTITVAGTPPSITATSETWEVYSVGIPYTVTAFPASSTYSQSTVSGTLISFDTHGSIARIRMGGTAGPQIFFGPVPRFGGHYHPVIDTLYHPGQFNYLEINGNTQSQQYDEAGQNPIWSASLTDAEEYGNCSPFSSGTGPYGGVCTAHPSALLIQAFRDVLDADSSGLNGDVSSGAPVSITSGATPTISSCPSIVNVNDTTAPTITLPAYCSTPMTIVDVGNHAGADTITISTTLTGGGTLSGSNTITTNAGNRTVRWSASGVATVQ